MRKILCWILVCGVAFISCSKDDSTPNPPNEKAEYVVMLYGCGGGNLDDYLKENIAEAESYGSNEKVKMTGIIKYSKDLQSDKDFSGTLYLDLTSNSGFKVDRRDLDFDLYEPGNLATFIKNSAEKYPAKKYILVLWNHGGSWDSIDDAPASRAILFDDNYADGYQCMSIFDVEKGIRLSGVSIEMVYCDACLMNMIENISQLKDCTNFVLASANTVPGEGGDYNALLKCLTENADTKDAMTKYVDRVAASWQRANVNKAMEDIALIDMKKIDYVLECMKPLPNALVESAKKNQELFYDFINSIFLFDKEEYDDGEEADQTVIYGLSTDLLFSLKYIAEKTGNTELASIRDKIGDALDEAYVIQRGYNMPVGMRNFSIGITWIPSGFWTQNSYELTYPLTTFDKAVQWSRFLKANAS